MRVTTHITIAAGVLTLIGASAAVANGPTAAADANATIKNDTGKRICRTVTPTGSRFTQRVCRTSDEWQKSEDDAQRQMQSATDTIRDNGPGLNTSR